MIVGNIDENTKEISLEFVKVDEKEFEEIEFDLSKIYSTEELIEKINNLDLPKNKYVKIILVGSKKIEIETLNILKSLTSENIIKIKDRTSLEVNLDDIASQNNLKGLFVKTLLERMKNEPENSEKIQKAIEIGLSSF